MIQGKGHDIFGTEFFSKCLNLGTDHLTRRGGGEVMVFVSFRIFFSDNTRVRILIYFVAQSANFFSRI